MFTLLKAYVFLMVIIMAILILSRKNFCQANQLRIVDPPCCMPLMEALLRRIQQGKICGILNTKKRRSRVQGFKG
jgi:hypothetical protein